MKGSHIIATTSLVIIQRFCLGDIEKYVCKKDHRYDKDHATHFTCKDDPGDFPAALEIKYEGDKDELKDKDCQGKYRFVAITNEHNSPVYVQEDEAHKAGNKASRSFIFRDWDDGTWIGTRSLEENKKGDDEHLWLKSACKQVDISKCKDEDWNVQTEDPNDPKKGVWKKNSVSLSFNFGLSTASIIGIVVGVVVLIAIIAIVAVLVVKKKRKNGNSPNHKIGANV